MTTYDRFFGTIALCLSLAAFGCGDDDGGSDDAGVSTDGGGEDAFVPETDGGTDAGTDAGTVEGCVTDCELEELALGVDFSCVRRASGEIRCWGGNRWGQLGDDRERHGGDCRDSGDTDVLDCAPPVTNLVADAVRVSARGGFSACAIDGSGELWCWGWENVNEIGSDDRRLRFVPVVESLPDGAGTPTDVSDGWLTNCAVADGTVYCLGTNEDGSIGTGTTTDVRELTEVVELSNVVDVEVAVFGGHACAIDDAGDVFCWGSNEDGQLGTNEAGEDCMRAGMAGTFDCATTPQKVAGLDDVNVVELSLGSRHVCALADDATLYCWGDNALGQLGTGDRVGQSEPVEITGVTGTVAQLAAGGSHTCVRLDDGTVSCWGAHDEGQLGDGQPVSGGHESCEFRSDLFDCSPDPVAVSTIDDAANIAAGSDHTCVIRGTSEVWCWGYSNHKQLGIDSRDRALEPVMVEGLDDY